MNRISRGGIFCVAFCLCSVISGARETRLDRRSLEMYFQRTYANALELYREGSVESGEASIALLEELLERIVPQFEGDRVAYARRLKGLNYSDRLGDYKSANEAHDGALAVEGISLRWQANIRLLKSRNYDRLGMREERLAVLKEAVKITDEAGFNVDSPDYFWIRYELADAFLQKSKELSGDEKKEVYDRAMTLYAGMVEMTFFHVGTVNSQIKILSEILDWEWVGENMGRSRSEFFKMLSDSHEKDEKNQSNLELLELIQREAER